MGTIADQFAAAFRDFVTDGLMASGDHEPVKADIRAIGPLIEAAVANAGLGALVSVVKTTKALLDADLAHDADAVALVYADATAANNDLYIKSGASGAGAWTNSGALHGIIDELAAPYIDALAATVTTNPADTDAWFVADSAGKKAARITRDGWFRSGAARFSQLFTTFVRARNLGVTDKTGELVADTVAAPGAAFQITDSAGLIALAVADGGKVKIADAAVKHLDARAAAVGALRFTDYAGRDKGGFAAAPGVLFPGSTDTSGRMIGAHRPDASPRHALLAGAARFSGARLCANATYTIEARQRADGSGGHDIWRISNAGGAQLRLSPVDGLDRLNPTIVSTPTGDYVIWTRRNGRKVEVMGVPIGGGAEVPMHPRDGHVGVGDSWFQFQTPSSASQADQIMLQLSLQRLIPSFASGGCTPYSDKIALLGGTISSALVGSTPTRAGFTSYTDNLDGTYTYPGVPRLLDQTLIWMQGAFELRNDLATTIQDYRDVITAQPAVHKRLLICQHGVHGALTPAQVTANLAQWASFKADPVLGPYCFDTYAPMRDTGFGSGGTVGPGGGEVYVQSHYGVPTDYGHLSATGLTRMGQIIADELQARGWAA